MYVFKTSKFSFRGFFYEIKMKVNPYKVINEGIWILSLNNLKLENINIEGIGM